MAAGPSQLEVSRRQPLHEEPPANGNGNGNGHVKVPTIGGEIVDVVEVAARVEAMDADEAIAWALKTFHPALRFATSFQKTSSVIIDMAHRIEPEVSFFYLDTELLFPETYETRDTLAQHFGIEFDRFAGITLEQQSEQHGANRWRRGADACWGIRKVEAMPEALDGAECRVSGIRRADTETRAGAAKFGWD